jgi:hypothetical protein
MPSATGSFRLACSFIITLKIIDLILKVNAPAVLNEISFE